MNVTLNAVSGTLGFSNLGGTIGVRVKVISTIQGTMLVRQRGSLDLPGSMMVKHRLNGDMTGTITVTVPQVGTADLAGAIGIISGAASDLPCFIFVRQSVTDTVPATIRVIRNAPPEDLHATIFVKPVSDLPGSISVKGSSLLPSTITVGMPNIGWGDMFGSISVRWNGGWHDLDGSIDVMQGGSAILKGQIFVAMAFLPATLTVKQRATSNINGSVFVMADTPGPVGSLRANVPNGEWTPTSQVTFLWNPAPPARTPILHYRYAISANPTPSQINTWQTTTDLALFHDFAGVGFGSGIWYFHIAAVNEAGNTGPVSSYTVQYNNRPTRPGILFMRVNEQDSTLQSPLLSSNATVMVTWSGSTDADQGDLVKYRVQFASRSDFSEASIVSTVENLTTAALILSPKPNPGTLFWRIQSYDGKQSSEWSPSGSFRLNAPPGKPTGLIVFDR
jgi:hypothetical protein